MNLEYLNNVKYYKLLVLSTFFLVYLILFIFLIIFIVLFLESFELLN